LHRTIEIVPPVKKIVRLVAPVLETKHDFRANAAAVVELNRNCGADRL
jgi:hypothetical protein